VPQSTVYTVVFFACMRYVSKPDAWLSETAHYESVRS